jgi:hypothetical protein
MFPTYSLLPYRNIIDFYILLLHFQPYQTHLLFFIFFAPWDFLCGLSSFQIKSFTSTFPGPVPFSFFLPCWNFSKLRLDLWERTLALFLIVIKHIWATGFHRCPWLGKDTSFGHLLRVLAGGAGLWQRLSLHLLR